MPVGTQAEAIEKANKLLGLAAAVVALRPLLEELGQKAMQVGDAAQQLPEHTQRFRTEVMFEGLHDAEAGARAAVNGSHKAEARFVAEVDMLCDDFGLEVVEGQVRVRQEEAL